MNAQKNKLTFIITLAIVSVLLLGGVSFTFFPTQTKQASTPQLTISSNSINQAYVPAAVNQSLQIIGGYAFFGGYTINSSLSSANNEPIGGLAFAVSDTSQRLDEITIGPDGSINSTTAPIRRVGDTYTLTADIINQTIIIQKDNIVLNGAGYTLGGFGHGYFSYAFEAIDLQGVKNVTVENFAITSFWRPIQAHNSLNLRINSNNLTDCPSVAITFDSVNNSVIANNFLAGTIDLWGNGGSQNNTIVGNTLSNIAEGIQIYGSNGNTITGNTLTNVYDSIGVSGNSTEISNNIIINGIAGIAADGAATVFGNFINNITDAALIVSDQNNRVYENTVENARYGVWLQASNSNASEDTVFYHNNFINNTEDVVLTRLRRRLNGIMGKWATTGAATTEQTRIKTA